MLAKINFATQSLCLGESFRSKKEKHPPIIELGKWPEECGGRLKIEGLHADCGQIGHSDPTASGSTGEDRSDRSDEKATLGQDRYAGSRRGGTPEGIGCCLVRRHPRP